MTKAAGAKASSQTPVIGPPHQGVVGFLQLGSPLAELSSGTELCRQHATQPRGHLGPSSWDGAMQAADPGSGPLVTGAMVGRDTGPSSEGGRASPRVTCRQAPQTCTELTAPGGAGMF